jgi:hypothetical protein
MRELFSKIFKIIQANFFSRMVGFETIRTYQFNQLLLPPLPNDLFIHHIWPWWCSPIHPVMLCHLKHVNWPLHHFVNSSLEWVALVFVCLDSLRYLVYVKHNGISKSTLIVRLNFELDLVSSTFCQKT